MQSKSEGYSQEKEQNENQNKEIFEVEREDLLCLIASFTDEVEAITTPEEEGITSRFFSKNDGREICRIETIENITKYYLFSMPTNTERGEQIGIVKVELQSPEAVNLVLNAINKRAKNG